ncbi:MAG TPA: PaaI family thioesterase [Candidatus Deferrimicrobium sp.]|nr:PaaI family thioesterase [Candidatus Deferrimicrobium sp.]
MDGGAPITRATTDGPTTAPADGAPRVVTVRGTGLTIEVAPHHCFACGALNEHGIHLDLHVDGDRCWTEVALPDRFQGWDGIAHGGIICTVLDEVMAWSLAATDNWGLTARMSVEFKRPVRTGVPIRGEGWITTARRRVVETAARLVDPRSGEVLATATAVYVAADAARKAELQARYRFRLTLPDPALDGGGSVS